MDHTAPKQRINAIVAKYKYPILILLLGLGLLLLPEGTPRETVEAPAQELQEPGLEERLEELLCQIQGAGQVRVLLTEDAGYETLYQTDSTAEISESGQRRTDEAVLMEDASRVETALVRQVREPTYRGAVILCQGAEDADVRLAIVEAVRCVTGLGADKITVLKMK